MHVCAYACKDSSLRDGMQRLFHLKRSSKTVTYYDTVLARVARSLPCYRPSLPPCDTRFMVTKGHVVSQELCRRENTELYLETVSFRTAFNI